MYCTGSKCCCTMQPQVTHQDRCSSQEGCPCSASAWEGQEQPCQRTLTRSAERLLIWHMGKGMCCCAYCSACCTVNSALSLPQDAACSHRAAARARSPSVLLVSPDILATSTCPSRLLWRQVSRNTSACSPSLATNHLYRHTRA